MPPRKPLIPIPPEAPPDVYIDHRNRLIALRDRLTEQLDVSPVAYTAGIARQLQSVLNELSTMRDPEAKPDRVEELRERRRARLEGSEVSGA